MKRALLLVLVALVLAACGSDKEEPTKQADDSVQEPDQSEESETNTSEADEANENAAEDEDASTSKNEKADDGDSGDLDHSAIEDFEEFDVIADNIDLDAYKSILETDNKGNRVILFEDESGEKEYKSVFVKHDKRLKIIKLKDDGLLFNEIID